MSSAARAGRIRRLRRLGLSVSCVALVSLLASGCSDQRAPESPADAIGPAVEGTATPSTAAPSPNALPTAKPEGEQPRTAVVLASQLAVDDLVTVTGTGWPSGSVISAYLCGNNFLNGTTDCDLTGGGQTVATRENAFQLSLEVSLPPKPCPCVIHVATTADPGTIDAPVTVIGAPEAPPAKTPTSRSLDVVSAVSGRGPWTAYFGGSAQRELRLTLTNTGVQPLTNVPLTLSLGKGEDTAEPLIGLGGETLLIPNIESGRTIVVTQDFEIDAPSFGTYTVRGTFVGLDSVTVDGAPQAPGDLTFLATTFTFPWGLVIMLWLLLQIPLLGLYKRRTLTVALGAAPGTTEGDVPLEPSDFRVLSPWGSQSPDPPQGFQLLDASNEPPLPAMQSLSAVEDLGRTLGRDEA